MILASLLSVVAVGLWPPGLARAENLSIGVQTDSVRLGINIGSPPRLVVVPGTPVYQAPSLPYNYFVYRKRYYLFHEGMWLSAWRHNGPWTVIAVERVPRPILRVPVGYYRNKPDHWKQHGPPAGSASRPWTGTMTARSRSCSRAPTWRWSSNRRGETVRQTPALPGTPAECRP